jgi:hypothetical protein
MARTTGPGAARPVSRATRQRQTAQALKEGRSPLGGKYREIVRKAKLKQARQRAYKNFHDQLHEYWRYNDDTVKEGCLKVMTDDQAAWTIGADADEIRDRAGSNSYIMIWRGIERNPWWYH